MSPTVLEHLDAQLTFLTEQSRNLHIPTELFDHARTERLELESEPEPSDDDFWRRRISVSYIEIDRLLERIENEQSAAFLDLLQRYGALLPGILPAQLWTIVSEGKDKAQSRIAAKKPLPLSAPNTFVATIVRASGEVNTTLHAGIIERRRRQTKMTRRLQALELLTVSLSDNVDEIGFRTCLGVAMGILL